MELIGSNPIEGQSICRLIAAINVYNEGVQALWGVKGVQYALCHVRGALLDKIGISSMNLENLVIDFSKVRTVKP